jgi:tetratricopeptide (TPR) repeat protein
VDFDAALDVLIEASLLEEGEGDRFHFHDLVRLHAREQAGDDRSAITRRIVQWYLTRTQAADRAVLGPRLRLAHPAASWASGEEFARPDEALGWLEAERLNLLAAVRAASDNQWYELVWPFCEALWALYDNRAHLADELEAARLGVAAARHLGDRPAEARMRNQVARALLRSGDARAASSEASAASWVAEGCGNRRVAAAVIETGGVIQLERGEYAAAIAAFGRARDVHDAEGNRRGVAMQRYQLGKALIGAGRPDEAMTELDAALRAMREIGHVLTQGKIEIYRGEAFAAREQRVEAVGAATRALEILASHPVPRLEVRALELLASVTDDPDVAEACRQRVRALQAAAHPTGT